MRMTDVLRRQDDVRTDQRLHLPEERALGLQVLEDALEDEIRPVESLVRAGWWW